MRVVASRPQLCPMWSEMMFLLLSLHLDTNPTIQEVLQQALIADRLEWDVREAKGWPNSEICWELWWVNVQNNNYCPLHGSDSEFPTEVPYRDRSPFFESHCLIKVGQCTQILDKEWFLFNEFTINVKFQHLCEYIINNNIVNYAQLLKNTSGNHKRVPFYFIKGGGVGIFGWFYFLKSQAVPPIKNPDWKSPKSDQKRTEF